MTAVMFAAYLCGIQGHVQAGTGTGTSPGAIVWSRVCSRCGAPLTKNGSVGVTAGTKP